jgi:hypothetical protein
MRLPGKAWLEFDIEKVKDGNRLSAIAYFQPRGIFGNVYWYIFLPAHRIVFVDLLRQIERKG